MTTTEHRCTDEECIYLGQPSPRGSCKCHKPREQMLADRIKRLEADLLECREYLEPEVDVIDGLDGTPHPNRAMALVSMIDESLHGPGNF